MNISKVTIRPEPERLILLTELPPSDKRKAQEENRRNIRQYLKRGLEKAVVPTIDKEKPYGIDTRHMSLVTTLKQGGSFVASRSRTLSFCERNHSLVEKDAIWKWTH